MSEKTNRRKTSEQLRRIIKKIQRKLSNDLKYDGQPNELYSACVRAAITKSMDFCLSACNSYVQENAAFILVSGLRGVCEDLIVLRYVSCQPEKIQNEFVASKQRENILKGILAQKHFMEANNPFQVFVGAGMSETKLSQDLTAERQKLKDLYKEIGTSKAGPTIRDMAAVSGLTTTYDFIYHLWLLLGSGVVTGTSRDQASDEGSEQGFAAPARVVHELEEAEVQGQLVLRDPPVRAQPGAQQGPETLHRGDVHLAEAVPVLVAGLFAAGVADRLVPVAPGCQARGDVVFVGVDEGAAGDRGRDDRLDRGLPHVGQHAQDHLAAALDQAEDGRLVLRQRAASRRARQLAPTPEPARLATAAGWPLWPATP